ncbi:MAG: hypothetical protein AAF236_07010 [Verrucomicrobiota bacterium]
MPALQVEQILTGLPLKLSRELDQGHVVTMTPETNVSLCKYLAI